MPLSLTFALAPVALSEGRSTTETNWQAPAPVNHRNRVQVPGSMVVRVLNLASEPGHSALDTSFLFATNGD